MQNPFLPTVARDYFPELEGAEGTGSGDAGSGNLTINGTIGSQSVNLDMDIQVHQNAYNYYNDLGMTNVFFTQQEPYHEIGLAPFDSLTSGTTYTVRSYDEPLQDGEVYFWVGSSIFEQEYGYRLVACNQNGDTVTITTKTEDFIEGTYSVTDSVFDVSGNFTAEGDFASSGDDSSDANDFISDGPYLMGDRGPAGGYIFYDDAADGVNNISNAQYLEVAPASTEWSSPPWGGFGFEIGTTAQGTELGSGKSNTDSIVASYGDSEPYNNSSTYAAKLCDDLSYGGYNDWFLPSSSETEIMFDNLYNQGLGDFTHTNYWTSTEDGPENVIGPYSQYYDKLPGPTARAVRMFSIGTAEVGTVVEFKILAHSFGDFVTKAFEPMTYNSDGSMYLNPTTSFEEDFSTLPEASITVDGNPQEWPSNKWMIEDTYHFDSELEEGADLTEFWLVRDGTMLAGAFILSSNSPNTNFQYVLHMAEQMGFGSGSPGYFIRYKNNQWEVTYRNGDTATTSDSSTNDTSDSSGDIITPDSDFNVAVSTSIEMAIPHELYGGIGYKHFEPIFYQSDSSELDYTGSLESDLTSLPSQTITIDGSFDDWSGVSAFFNDPIGDENVSVAGADLTDFSMAQDSTNLYVRFELADSSPNKNNIYILHMADSAGFGWSSSGFAVMHDGTEWVGTTSY